ncbi:leucine-rich repeat-containing protein 24-like [Harmonia axyridis]|uniref:leucine-rich repeat-containing protein 24-like n=1 Tax=Harmonia axyridis TaxID=115357 RepID=UPI001E275099|nr:leucine-rich repeat-containing protein 24-like [Harmonia axyridis]XP_045480629.1 leucine-rich repeat-containing protein 24-like [Harmonia axyridis]XP_045480630.1 leucine-rich repeat-containing protein 24-like [Harmonia axyridis]
MDLLRLLFLPIILTTHFNRINCDPDCPKFCTCKWKNGKQTVECISRGLEEVPDHLDPATQVLDFSGNKLVQLKAELFVSKKMVNLQRIYLSRCSISTIEDHAFKDLTNLVELDLSENQLGAIPTAIFEDIPSLMRLSMKLNRIGKLESHAFSQLSYLTTLELSDCGLEDIHERAFDGLHSLEWLHLDGNKLTHLKGERTLPDTLKGVDLYNNPWECDCHIADFHTWLERLRVPLSVEPVCNGPPRLEGRVIKTVKSSDLACLPDISPTTFFLELSEGKNVSLVCNIKAIPEAKVSWWFHGQILQNNSLVAPGLHLVYFVEEGVENKKSELYLFNTNVNDNGTFICNAENAAGRSQANFTIRVILKKEPIVIIVSLKFEYLMAIVIGIAAAVSLVVLIALLLILKCLRKRRRRQKVKTETHSSPVDPNNTVKTIPDPMEISTMYSATVNNTPCTIRAADNVTIHAQRKPIHRQIPLQPVHSPPFPVRYQLKQNPDVINGAQMMGYRENGDGEDGHIRRFSGSDHASLNLRSADPAEDFGEEANRHALDSDGYPSDFGLPRMPRRVNENFYRTLPNSRIKYHSAANPAARYSREAEFLSRSTQATSYDHFHADIRYTADGYPVRIDKYDSLSSSSPPESFRSESAVPPKMESCCRTDDVHVVMAKVEKRCASAQTDEEVDLGNDKGEGDASLGNEGGNVLTPSPDEGYGGEPTAV